MTELLTSAQMRAIESAAIASGQVTGLDLMERAGASVVDAIFQQWPKLRAGPRRALVLCGPGNNGGDGFVVARLLHGLGWRVEVFLLGPPERLPPDASRNHARWCEMGTVRNLTWDEAAHALLAGARDDDPPLASPPVVIDALFGTGLTRRIEGDPGRITGLLSDMVAGQRGMVVAVDLPSGLCSDSGRALGHAASANLTVSFHRAKLGHHLAEGPERSGRLVVTDIGLGGDVGGVSVVQGPGAGIAKRAGHKFSHGHALVLSGPIGRGGAARLAARGALRIGAGVVTVGCPPGAVAEHAARLDAVMLRKLGDGADLAEALADRRITALCLGPGLGTGPREAGLIATALERPGARPLVLDADALTILAQRPDLAAGLHGACVLTPHAGEFSRLFPDIAAKLAEPATGGPAFSKVDAARAAAERARCVVLFKGPDTVIADPSGRCAIHSAQYDRAAPWLATAGSGDVLAGFIAGLLARGFAPFDAACAAAWLHVDCALAFGPGLVAEDLPESLPAVFRKCLAQ